MANNFTLDQTILKIYFWFSCLVSFVLSVNTHMDRHANIHRHRGRYRNKHNYSLISDCFTN